MKLLGNIIGFLGACSHLLGYLLASLVLGHERAFVGASERVARVPGYLGLYVRRAFYKVLLDHVGADTYLGFLTLFSKRQARIGDRVYIGRMCTIGWADVGDDVMIADGVQVLSGRHTHGSEVPPSGGTLRDNDQQFTKVTIGKGAWIGAGAIIMADVGANAIVGAGAVVTKPVPTGTKVGGVPAKALTAASASAARG